MKRKVRDEEQKQASSKKTKTSGSTALSIPKQPKSSLTRQAIRTGGWADPSRGGELKFVDNVNNTDVTVAVTTFTTPLLLNGLAQGTTASTRVGRKIVMKSILIRYSQEVRTTTVGAAGYRILVVYDKQANATAPAVTDILENDTFNSPNNLSNRDRFVTIFDHMAVPIGANGPQAHADVLFKRLNLETLFNGGSAGTIGDITSGSVYMMMAQSGGWATAAPDFLSRIRIRYTDV